MRVGVIGFASRIQFGTAIWGINASVSAVYRFHCVLGTAVLGACHSAGAGMHVPCRMLVDLDPTAIVDNRKALALLLPSEVVFVNHLWQTPKLCSAAWEGPQSSMGAVVLYSTLSNVIFCRSTQMRLA